MPCCGGNSAPQPAAGPRTAGALGWRKFGDSYLTTVQRTLIYQQYCMTPKGDYIQRTLSAQHVLIIIISNKDIILRLL